MSDEAIAIKPEKLTCGLIMPISQLDNLPPAHWDEIKEIITKTVEGIPDPRFTARLVSEGDDAGVIHKRIIQNVYTDDIAICDVSGRNANVMFELGMRLAFDKPTVIIKDDQTPRIFDTDVIEYVTYRRDLRYASMESFKAKLAQKVIATYQTSKTDHDKQSFLKSFGTFKVVKLDEASESPDRAILSMLAQMDRKISRISRETNFQHGSITGIHHLKNDDILMSSKFIEELASAISEYEKEHPPFSFDNIGDEPNSDRAFTKAMAQKFPSELPTSRHFRQAMGLVRLIR